MGGGPADLPETKAAQAGAMHRRASLCPALRSPCDKNGSCMTFRKPGNVEHHNNDTIFWGILLIDNNAASG